MAKSKVPSQVRKRFTNPTANETLLNDGVRHATYLHRFANGEVQDVVGFMNRELVPSLKAELQRRLDNVVARGLEHSSESNARLQALLNATEKMIGAAMEDTSVRFGGSLRDFALSEGEWAKANITKAAPVELALDLPNAETLRSIVTSRPFEGRLLNDWFTDLGTQTQKNLQRVVNVGIASGQTNDEIVRGVIGTRASQYSDGILSTTRRGAEAVVRTAINHVSSNAREETYKANDDVVDQVRWVSTLDDRTTLICMDLDGQLFNINEGPRPPAHIGCRSTTVPVLKSWKELGIDLAEAPAGTRASMDGQVPDDINYNDWLRSQSEDVQNEALGPARADLFRDGMDVSKFVNDKGQTLTLEELRKKEGLE